MPPPTQHGPNFNEELRTYVFQRDKGCCQWPGCGNTYDVEVLFIVETENGGSQSSPFYKNGITFCQKHLDIVNLHDKAFGPLVYDLIQLVEFENDLKATEKMYKDLLR